MQTYARESSSLRFQLTVEWAGFIGDLHSLAGQPPSEQSMGSFGNRNALHSYLHV